MDKTEKLERQLELLKLKLKNRHIVDSRFEANEVWQDCFLCYKMLYKVYIRDDDLAKARTVRSYCEECQNKIATIDEVTI